MDNILSFLVILFVVAAFLRDEFVFNILYLFTGAYLIGRWWSGYSLRSIRFARSFTPRAFLNERAPVRLEIENRGWLPVVWLRLQDSLPVELSLGGSYKRVVSLGPHQKATFDYDLITRKRGCYQVGPVNVTSGDIFGLGGEQRSSGLSNTFTVYPKVYMLTSFLLPSRSPMGTLRYQQPIFEDPTRVLSKRDYVVGDSLRRVDWKATAVLGRLQVKKYEPSIALETMIFLNLNYDEYELRSRFDSTELAIVIAASIANWVTEKKQTVGLVTNGLDPLGDLQPFSPLPSRKGQAHLMRLLEILARIQATEASPFVEQVHRESIHLSWGTTLVLITGQASDTLFDELFHLRRSGLNLVLVLVGNISGIQKVRQRARYFNIPLFTIRNEKDLDIWRH